MSLLRSALAFSLLCAAPLPAFAQATEAAVSDPARIALAQKVMLRLLPDGIYKKMMAGSLSQMMDGMLGQMKEMSLRDLSLMTGRDEADFAGLPEATLGQVMEIMDPAYEERMKLTTRAVMGEMGDVMAMMEPEMRAGMAEAYARRFDVRQLTELDAFFSTPTGSTYASEQFMLMMDPAVMSRMQALVPTVMKAMPTIMQKAEAATAHLPKPRKPSDLSAAEVKKLEALMGKSK